MNLNSMQLPVTSEFVGMGQIGFAQEPTLLTAVLGSCIGVILYHPRRHISALAHIVLPNSNGKDGAPGKYADTAIKNMVARLQKTGLSASGIRVKMAGGAHLFETNRLLRIGDENVKAVTNEIEKHGLRVVRKTWVARKVGGLLLILARKI